MFRIRKVLILIQTRRSVLLDHGSGSHSFFSSVSDPGCYTVEEGNTEHLSAFNIILKILRNIFSGIFFHRRSNE